ncbi:cell division protein FtsX [Coprobacter fastidiosus]|uniref:Cell division protein FtsX n=1 Tax=Coprobacter fastidiosus NSB1 = JCM 33896 TaxID=1349822 RepID=A0A495WGR9_9BACT|nr:permease-like cell division protein FtsX [Coprobacter fastidiosus]ERM90355.1 cell division protein FtsX [Coprobacter fastidiosus NSB1 = JCM 33896]RKT59028.1 cell division transport system permease protein [Coprobacter fastidiosus NSB1 = JCM 33896]
MSESKSGRHITFFNARLTSTISISLVLFILGIVVLMGILATRLSMYVKENMGFSIVLKENVTESQVKKLQKKLDIAPYVRATQYISKEDALKELEVELGENPKDLLGFNPLQASIEVKLRSDYAHPDSLVWIEKGLRKGTVAIDDIVYQKDLIQLVNDNIRRISFMLLGLAVVLMLISFALISNTIRLGAYSKRFIIHTMKLVGATPAFIRKPFIISNIINGIIGAFIAMALLSGCVYYLLTEFDNLYTLIDISSLFWVFVIVLLLGVVLTAISAWFAVNRYIRMDRDNLYYV